MKNFYMMLFLAHFYSLSMEKAHTADVWKLFGSVVLQDGEEYKFPRLFLKSLRSKVIKSDKLTINVDRQAIVFAYQLFTLALMNYKKEILFYPVLQGLCLPRSINNAFEINDAAKKAFKSREVAILKQFRALLSVDKNHHHFIDLEAGAIEDHWRLFVANKDLAKRQAVELQDEREAVLRSCNKANVLFQGLVRSYCASFVRYQIDSCVARLFKKDFSSQEVMQDRCFYAFCDRAYEVAQLFVGQKSLFVPGIRLIANFARDHKLSLWAQGYLGREALDVFNKMTRDSLSFSINDLVKEDHYALKRLVPARPYSHQWASQYALVDLADMGLRSMKGMDLLLKKVAKEFSSLSIAPFFARTIAMLPETLSADTYVFMGVRLDNNMIQRLSFPQLQSDHLDHFLFLLEIRNNPIYSTNIKKREQEFNYTKIILDFQRMHTFPLPKLEAILSSHNKNVQKKQKELLAKLEQNCITREMSSLVDANSKNSRSVVKTLFVDEKNQPISAYLHPLLTDKKMRSKKKIEVPTILVTHYT